MLNLKSAISYPIPCNGTLDKHASPVAFNFNEGQTFFSPCLSVADLSSRQKKAACLLYLRARQKVNRVAYSNGDLALVHFVATGDISEVGNESVIN